MVHLYGNIIMCDRYLKRDLGAERRICRCARLESLAPP
jgi:hypothetical protein